jgi:hypothetical protein
MKKLILILLLSSCVTPADPIEKESLSCTSCATTQSSAKTKIDRCPAGKPCYVNEEGQYLHAIQPGPDRVQLIECTHE